MKTLLKTVTIFILTLLFSSCSNDDNIEMAPEIFNPVIGDIIITEIMPNPMAVSDSDGEWFEIYNTSTTKTINLKEVLIHDRDSGTHNIIEDVIIEPNSYLVFGVNNNTSTNGGITVDYVYSNITLSNLTDNISLSYNGATLDDTMYIGSAEGKSLNLNPDKFTHTENNDPSNWCEATNQLPSGDFATPKESNTNCI